MICWSTVKWYVLIDVFFIVLTRLDFYFTDFRAVKSYYIIIILQLGTLDKVNNSY